MKEVLLPDPKSQIKLLLQENQSLSEENLDDIERLFSKSEIKRLINLSPDTYHTFIAHQTIFTAYNHLNIRDMLWEIAVERLKKDLAFEQHMPDKLLFDEVLKSARSVKWYNRKSFCSLKNRVVRLALERIKRDLAIPEKRDDALRSLEKYPIELIKETFRSMGSLNLLENSYVKHLKIDTVWAEHTTPEFQEVLNTKNVDEFIRKISTVNEEMLEKLMLQLISRIKNSFFKDKYEKMLEVCFVRVMELTPPREAMKLDTQILVESLRVFDGYLFNRSRRRFFEKPGQDGYNMLAYFRRTVLTFNTMAEFEALCPSYTMAEISQFDDARLDQEIKSGKVGPQILLFSLATDSDSFETYKNLAERLVKNHGANLEWMNLYWSVDPFEAKYKAAMGPPYFDNYEFTKFSFLLSVIVSENNSAWDFYIDSKGGDLNVVFEAVIDSYLECKKTRDVYLRGGIQHSLYSRCENVIRDLLESSEVVVTQEMLDKYDDAPWIKKMLEDKREARRVPVSSDNKHKEERHLNISTEEAAVAVSAMAARDAVEKRRSSSMERVEQFVPVPRPRTPPF